MLQTVEKLPAHRVSQGWNRPLSGLLWPPLSNRYKAIYRAPGGRVGVFAVIFRILDLCFEYHAQIRRNRGGDRRYHQETAEDRARRRISHVAHHRRGRDFGHLPLRTSISRVGRNHTAVRWKAIVARGRRTVRADGI